MHNQYNQNTTPLITYIINLNYYLPKTIITIIKFTKTTCLLNLKHSIKFHISLLVVFTGWESFTIIYLSK